MSFWKELLKKLSSPFAALIYSMLIVCFTIGAIIVIAFSWFTNSELVEPDLSGFSVSAYFGGGNGSEDDPFLIKNQRHLYNLCWLQYLGYFNKEGQLDSNGRIITEGHNNELTQYSFSITTDLNMNGWYLPPLGTTLQPFIGQLDGQGHKISNLHTTNTFSEFGTRHPSSVTSNNFANCEVIGFAGVIGIVTTMNLYGHSILSNNNAVTNIKLVNTQVRTTSNDLIGIAAGLINGTVEDIGIVNSGLYINTSSSPSNEYFSMYTVAGYATDGYVTKKTTTNTTVLNPTNTITNSYVFEDSGDTTGWGGSIDMESLHTRIAHYSDLMSYGMNYIYAEKKTVTSSGTTVSDQVNGKRRYNNYYTAGTYAAKYIPDSTDYSNGVYLLDLYKKQVDGMGTRYNYLTGLYKTVRYIYVLDNTEPGYKISDGNGNYLCLIDGSSYGNCTLGNQKNENTATVWVYDDSNHSLYTYSRYDGYKYYLNGTTTLSLSTTNSTTNWTWDSTVNTYRLSYNNYYYFLTFTNNNWTLETQNYHYIHDNNGNYLSLSGTSIVNVTNVNNAVLWKFSNTGTNPSGTISTIIGNTTYYLSLYNNVLQLRTSSTNWNNSGNGLNSNGYYIQFRDGQWIASNNRNNITGGYYISDGNGNYLANELRALINETDINNATKWSFSSTGTNPSGTISTIYNGSTYYIYRNTSLNTKSATWTNNNGKLTYRRDDRRYYYISYDDGDWHVTETSSQALATSSATQLTITAAPDSIYYRSYVSDYQYIDTGNERIQDNINVVNWEEKDEVSEYGYIPLNTELVNNNYKVKSTNTGYIIGGGYETTNNYKGDIRVSYYPIQSSSSQKGIDGSYNGSSFTAIYTVNDSGNNIDITNSTSYTKFSSSKTKFLQVLAGETNVYGLHFMDNCNISTDRLITAKKVLINGEYNTDYQMPEDCIDFRLAEKGIINFFAGYYFNNNNSFFSLNQIIRDSDNNITSIKHITRIYKTNNAADDYIYVYEDGTSTGDWSGKTKVFDSSWIENPAMSTNNYLYYFEIPVNSGEYALGCVKTTEGTRKIGAYLLYLDIGANAQEINRTEIRQKSTVTKYDYIYPNGIAVITENTTINPNAISLDASTSGVLKIKSLSGQSENTIVASRTETNAVNFVTNITDTEATYVPRTVTVTKNSGAVTAAAVKTTTSIYSQILYIDHNVSTGDIFETIIQKIDSNDPTYNIYQIGESGTTAGYARVEIDQTSQKPKWRLYAVDNVNKKNVLVDLGNNSDTYANAIKSTLDTIASSTGTSILEFDYDAATGATNTYAIHINMAINSNDLYYYTFTGDDITVTTDNTGGTIVYVTIVNTTYTFKLNGTTMVVGTNIPVTQS